MPTYFGTAATNKPNTGLTDAQRTQLATLTNTAEKAQYIRDSINANRNAFTSTLTPDQLSAYNAENTVIIFSADHGMPFPFSKATVYDYVS